MRRGPLLVRRLIASLLLVLLGCVAVIFLNGALFSAWMSGGPPNPYPEGWALRSQAQLIWALSSAVAGAAIFLAVMRHPNIRRWHVGLVVVSLVLAALPFAAKEVLIDKCLDSGGRWNYEGLQCER
jgi:hypothetical protein